MKGLLMIQIKCPQKISRELFFVLGCVNKDEKIISSMFDQELDWEHIQQLAFSHYLYPLVYDSLMNYGNSLIPEKVIQALKKQFLISAFKVTSQNDDIIRIVKGLNDHGISPIVLKGPPLSTKINEDIVFRPSHDIDILVDPHDFDTTEKVLEQMGYIRYSPDFPLTPRQRKTFLEIHHHFEYYHPHHTATVELHWKIRSFNVSKVPTAYNIGKQLINVYGTEIPVMDNENWLLFLMIHGYKHFWNRLRWLYDIKEYMKTPIDWNRVVALADQYESKVVLHQTLILENFLFNVPFPACLEKSLNADRKAMKLAEVVVERLCINESKYRNPIHNFLESYHYSNYTIKNKLNHLRYLTKPGLEEFKLISLPDFLFPIYYLIRPIYWLIKRIPIFSSSKV